MVTHCRQGMKHYLNNRNLKAAGVVVDFTAEQTKEYIKCSRDPFYFIENYVKIVSVDEGLVPFKLWPFQRDIVQTIHDNRYTIAKLPRQCGKSTTMVSYLLWTILFKKLQNVCIAADKGSTAKEILHRLQRSYEALPLWMQQGVIEWNKGSVVVENGSRIIAASTASNSIRGHTYNIIMLDEFAFVPRNIAEDFIKSVFPTITSGKKTKVMIVSTPNGMNLFCKYWKDAQEKRNLYVPVEAHWSDRPDRDAEWERETRMQMGDEEFNQEFGCDFLGSASTLISTAKLKELTWIDPIRQFENGFKVYEEPKDNHSYVLVSDVSEGQGLDCSAFSVVDVSETPYAQVATYRSANVSPMLYPNIIYNAAKYYHDAHVLIEVNNIGMQVANDLYDDLEYEYIFATTVKGRGGQQISAGFSNNSKLGIKTSESLKKVGCANLKSMIEGDRLIINDFDTYSELTSFARSKKSYEAEAGCNDDLVMGLVMFGWLSTQQYFKDITDIDIRKKLYSEKMRQLEEEMLPDIFINNGSDGAESFVDSSGDRWFTIDDDDWK